MSENQLSKPNHHFLLLRDSVVTHILVTTTYEPLDLLLRVSAEVVEPAL